MPKLPLARTTSPVLGDVPICKTPAGAVLPMPILLFCVSKFKSPDSIFSEVVEELAIFKVEALASERVAALMVSVSPDSLPKLVFPSK